MKRRVEKAARREAAARALVVGKEEGSTALFAAPGPSRVHLKTHQTTNPHKSQDVPNCLARKETGRERWSGGDGEERKGKERAKAQVNSPPGRQRAFSGLFSQAWKNLLRNPQMTGCNFLCSNLQNHPPPARRLFCHIYCCLLPSCKYIFCIL